MLLGKVLNVSIDRFNVLPVCDIQLSINFWREDKTRAFGYVREVACENQPSGYAYVPIVKA